MALGTVIVTVVLAFAALETPSATVATNPKHRLIIFIASIFEDQRSHITVPSSVETPINHCFLVKGGEEEAGRNNDNDSDDENDNDNTKKTQTMRKRSETIHKPSINNPPQTLPKWSEPNPKTKSCANQFLNHILRLIEGLQT